MNPIVKEKLTSKQTTELEKYLKFLFFKVSQLVVQSRFGEKNPEANSRKIPPHDWFNLAIEDHEEIQAKAKDAYSKVQLLKDFSICIEILLKTSDGDTLVLETWHLNMITSNCLTDSPYISHTSLASVYCRMTLLLKSVIAVTRITPAYRLSIRQSADTYVILYRIYSDEPQVYGLGKNYIKNKIGQIITPVGDLNLSVFYRSKDHMTITPQKINKTNSFLLKSNYFKPDKGHNIINSGGFQIKNSSTCGNPQNDIRKTGAFASPSSLQDNLFPDLDVLEKPFLNLSRSKLHNHTNKLKWEDSLKKSKENANLNQISAKKVPSELDYNCNSNEEICQKQIISDFYDPKDFLLLEMKPPFAECDVKSDIGVFFRECSSAPPLASFTIQPTLEEQVYDITTQLVKFETSMNEYDYFVDSICHLDGVK